MSEHVYECEFDEFLGIFFATVLVEFTYKPYDRESHCSEEIVLNRVTLTSLEGDDFQKSREEIEVGGWNVPLDAVAFDFCEQEIDARGWLEDDLICIARDERKGR